MAESTASLRAEIKALSGVDIMLNENTFKSTYQVMDELSQKWADLSDIAQATIIELMAGKHQGNIFSSLMANFDTARDALETSLNSSGSAMREHEKWQQSLEAQINKLKAAWQGLSQAFLKSDFLHGAFDFVIKLVDGITLLIDKVGVLPTLFTGFSIFKSFGNKGIFKTFNNDLNGFTNKLGIVNKSFRELSDAFKSGNKGGFKGFFNGLKSMANALIHPLSNIDLSAIESYNNLIDEGINGQEAFARTMNGTSNAAQNLVQSANGGKVALNGMKTASLGAKVGLIGAKVAAVAFNAALTMGISLLVDWAISGIMKLVNRNKELAESVGELTSKFKEEHDELKKLKNDYDTSNESSMISRYEKLSKGVDNLGRNVSLTSEEYSEYQSIVNKIADQIPSLVSGYDSQGNALLSVKGNVEELTKAYEKLIHAQNQKILTNSKNIEKDFANTIKDANSNGFWKEWVRDDILLKNFGISYAVSEHIDYDLTTGSVAILEDLLNADLDELSDKIKNISKEDLQEIKSSLQDAGVDINNWAYLFDTRVGEKQLEETLKTDPAKVKGIIDDYYEQFADAVSEQKTIAQAKLSEAFDVSSAISGLDYSNISEDLQAVAYQVIGSLDEKFFGKLQKDGKTVEQWTTEMLNQLNSIGKENNNQISAAFDLQTQFNGGEISYGEYVKGLEDTGELIAQLNLKDEVKSQLKLSLGLDEKGLVDEYQRLRNRLVSDEYFDITASQYESFIEGLSSEELSVVWDVIAKFEKTDVKETIADIKSALKLEMMKAGLTFDLNLEVETAGIDALNTALAESVSATGLSSESITALKGRYAELESQGYDLSVLFEETSHGIHLNRQEFNKLEKAYATDKLAKVDADLQEMKGTYDDLGEAIKNTDDPVRKAELYNDRQTLAKRISEAATLATQYEGLTSAYNDWLAAEDAGQERDMYENVISGFENINDELSRGWADDGTIKFLELLTGRTDLAGKSAKELKKVYNDLDKSIKYIGKDGKVLEDTGYSIRDFFTVDDEGNSTADGIYNFLDAIGKLEEEAFGGKDVVKRDKNGKIISFDFELAGGDEAIADALGISKELVQIMKRAADDAGFVVSMDGTYRQLADLQNEARAAANYLKEIGKTDFEFDFNTTSVSSLTSQLEEAKKILKDKDFWNKDGTFNFNADGATQAMQIVSTLQAKLDNLTEKKYGIGLTVEDEEFEEPLEKLQEYGHTIQTLNQLNLNPKANADEIKKLNGELNDIAKYFANLDKETKVKLGFESDDSIDEIKKKIENGEVKIPTVLDIQTNMDKNLETLADLALLNSGLLTADEEEVIRKKYKVEVNADEVDTTSFDEKVNKEINATDEERNAHNLERNISIIADTLGVEDVEDLSTKLKSLDDKTIQTIAEVVGQMDVDKLKQTIALLEPKKVEAIVEAMGQGDVDALKTAINQLEPRQVQAIAEALGYDDVNELNIAIEGMDGNVVQAIAQALGLDNVNTLQSAVSNMEGNTVDAKVNTEGQSSKIDTLQSKIDGMHGNTVDIVVNTIKNVIDNGAKAGKKALKNRFGIGGVNGTANVNGTTGRAFKQGSWGTKNSGTALVGELGRETLVRDGRYYTIGDTGAEFIKYKKGDIIFNHKQTEELFKNGKVTSGGGRAQALSNGTAFAQGTAFASGKSVDTEIFDWMEIAISRLERVIDKLDQTVNNVYKSWNSRNSALEDEIINVGKEIRTQNSAKHAYLANANKVDFSGYNVDYAKLVREGAIDTSDITDEELKNKIKEYEEWYNKYLDCTDAVEKLKQTESELYMQRFEDVQTYYDGIIQGYEHTESMLDEYISQSEEKGHIVSKNYYQALIDNESKNIAKLKQEQSDLIAKRDEAVASGKIVKGSQAWYDMCAEIDGVTQAIEQGTTALIEYDNAMRDIDWSVFDLIQERISDVAAEADFLIELMSHENLFDDNGKFTDKGMATAGLHAQNYNTYMYQADDYGNQIKELDAQIAQDPYDQELINRRKELIELQRESILNAEDEKQAIKDLVSEGIEKELDALQERIDLHNEELDSIKDLYDYQKEVQKQSEEIASLEKQRAAYLNDDSESGKAKLQEITVSLKEAKENLQETEFDRYISQQEQLLSTLYDEYSEILNTRLDNVDALVSDVITEVNTSAATISTTISTEAASVGATLSEAMKGIWSGEGEAKSVISEYSVGFQNNQTTTNAVLSQIKANIDRMVDDIDKDATTKVTANKTSSSAVKNPTGNTTNNVKDKTSTPRKSAGDGVPKVGDKVKFVSGKYYYDSQGKKPLGSHYQGKQVYITKISSAKWSTYPYHISTGNKLGKGDLGWLKLNQLSGYATGKKNFSNSEIAWTQEKGQEFIVRPSDGAILTPVAKGDSVLTHAASNNIWDMANSPADFIKDNLNLGATNIPNNSTVQNNITQHLDKVVFNLPNVKNYDELLSTMQKDKNFERLITSMTIDQIAGKSSLGKNKSIR